MLDRVRPHLCVFLILKLLLSLFGLLIRLLFNVLALRHSIEGIFFIRKVQVLDLFGVGDEFPPGLVVPDYVLVMQPEEDLDFADDALVFCWVVLVEAHFFYCIEASIDFMSGTKNSACSSLPNLGELFEVFLIP